MSPNCATDIAQYHCPVSRQKAEGRRQKAKAEGRRQKAKGKRQKAKGKRQKAKGRRHKGRRQENASGALCANIWRRGLRCRM
jgi:hypothetical protein